MCKIHIKDSLHTGGLIRKFHQHLGGPKTWRPSPGGLLISSVRENQIHNYILRPHRAGNVGFHTKELFLITKYDKYIWKFLKSFIFLGLKMHKVEWEFLNFGIKIWSYMYLYDVNYLELQILQTWGFPKQSQVDMTALTLAPLSRSEVLLLASSALLASNILLGDFTLLANVEFSSSGVT